MTPTEYNEIVRLGALYKQAVNSLALAAEQLKADILSVYEEYAYASESLADVLDCNGNSRSDHTDPTIRHTYKYATFDRVWGSILCFSGIETWGKGGQDEHTFELPLAYLFDRSAWEPALREKLAAYLVTREQEEHQKLDEKRAMYEKLKAEFES